MENKINLIERVNKKIEGSESNQQANIEPIQNQEIKIETLDDKSNKIDAKRKEVLDVYPPEEIPTTLETVGLDTASSTYSQEPKEDNWLKTKLKNIWDLINRNKRRAFIIGAFTTMSIAGNAKDNKNHETDSLNKNKELTIKSKENSAEMISDQLRNDWNNYTDWLEKQGLKGSDKLDHNNLGFEMIDKYRAELEKQGKTTLVSKTSIKDIQKEFNEYRKWSLNRIHEGKASFGAGANEENYMANLSIIDGIPGQRTTSFKFPKAYLVDKNNQLVNKNIFAKASTMINSSEIASN